MFRVCPWTVSVANRIKKEKLATKIDPWIRFCRIGSVYHFVWSIRADWLDRTFQIGSRVQFETKAIPEVELGYKAIRFVVVPRWLTPSSLALQPSGLLSTTRLFCPPQLSLELPPSVRNRWIVGVKLFFKRENCTTTVLETAVTKLVLGPRNHSVPVCDQSKRGYYHDTTAIQIVTTKWILDWIHDRLE